MIEYITEEKMITEKIPVMKCNFCSRQLNKNTIELDTTFPNYGDFFGQFRHFCDVRCLIRFFKIHEREILNESNDEFNIKLNEDSFLQLMSLLKED